MNDLEKYQQQVVQELVPFEGPVKSEGDSNPSLFIPILRLYCCMNIQGYATPATEFECGGIFIFTSWTANKFYLNFFLFFFL